MTKLCSIPGCGKPVIGRGWCSMHYTRWRMHGDTSITLAAAPGSYMKWLQEFVGYEGLECLKWPFYSSHDGRPNTVKYKGRQVNAARAMCILAHGNPPTPTHQAAHSCGKALEGCVNPQHLSWKTCAQNHEDKILHGTLIRGSQHRLAKLSESQVMEIREVYAKSGISHQQIAIKFGVSRRLVSGIIARKKWEWLP